MEKIDFDGFPRIGDIVVFRGISTYKWCDADGKEHTERLEDYCLTVHTKKYYDGLLTWTIAESAGILKSYSQKVHDIKEVVAVIRNNKVIYSKGSSYEETH